MPLVALHDREAVAVLRSASLRASIVSVAISVLRLGETAEVVEEVPDGVGGRNEVGVEDHHVFGAWVHPSQCFLQRTALEALAARAVDDADARMLLPLVELLDGLVGGVVGDDDLVVLVVERGARFEEPVDDALLVVEREVDRDEGLAVRGEAELTHPLPGVGDHDRAGLAQLLATESAVALFVLAVGVAVADGLAIGLQAVAIRVSVAVSVGVATLKLRGIAKERDEDDARDRDVVLERVEEEDQTAEEREQRERETRRERVADEEAEAADTREHDHGKDHARVELAQEVPGPDHLAAAAAVPHAIERVFNVVGGRGDARQLEPRVALGLGEGDLVQRVGHGDDTVAAVRRGDHEGQPARHVERHRAGRVALDRVDQAR